MELSGLFRVAPGSAGWLSGVGFGRWLSRFPLGSLIVCGQLPGLWLDLLPYWGFHLLQGAPFI